MAEETKDVQARVVTADEALAYERDIQLGNPSEVRMPDGRTLEEFQKDTALRQREEARESAEREDAGIRRETSAVMPDVFVTTTDGGGVFTPPAQTLEEAVEEDRKRQGGPETSEPLPDTPSPLPESNAEPTASTVRTKRKASEPTPATPPVPAE